MQQTDRECPMCEDGLYVKYDTAVQSCNTCHYSPESGPQDERVIRDADPWVDWWEHRRSDPEIDGWHDHDRVKMVGGFAAAYDY